MTQQERVRIITNPKEVDETHIINAGQWGKGLTLDQYIGREQHLDAQESCLNGNFKAWAYEIRDNDDAEWQRVSCFETLERPAFYKQKGSEIEYTSSYSIGAVFTPEEHRGKGYAYKMLKLGNDEIDKNSDPHSFIALWSDVGLYYERVGYKLTENRELILKRKLSASVEVPAGVTPIYKDGVAEFARKDTAQFRQELETKVEKDGITRVVIEPTKIVHDLTHARVEYLAPILRPSELKSEGKIQFGAQYGLVSMLWAQDLSNDKVNVLRVLNEGESGEKLTESLEVLLTAAIDQAARWNLSKVAFWVQDVPVADKLGLLQELEMRMDNKGVSANIDVRDGSWPMVRFNHGKCADGEMEWINDGKYAWF